MNTANTAHPFRNLRDGDDDGGRVFAAYDGADVATDEVRMDTFDGEDYVVAPVVAVQEAVLKGQLLPEGEIQRASASFAGRPLPVNHPKDGDEYVSANTTERLSALSVGSFFGQGGTDAPRVKNSQLAGEIWVGVEKSNRLAKNSPERGLPLAVLATHLDADVASNLSAKLSDQLNQMAVNVARLRANDDQPDAMLEVSTAYWFDPEPKSGVYNGESYDGVQRNLKPDHLALLPRMEGECSVEDGCGAPRLPSANDASDADSAFFLTAAEGGDTQSGESFTTDQGADADDDCGCSHPDDTDSQTNTTPMDYAQLSSETGVPVEALRAMTSDQVKTVAANHDVDLTDDFDFNDDGDATTDDDAQNGDDQTDQTGNDDDTDDDTPDLGAEVQSAVQSAVEPLQEKVEQLEGKLVAQEFGGEDPHDLLKANSDMDDDVVDDLSEQQAAAMARELAKANPAAATDMSAMGAGMTDPAARTGGGGGDADGFTKAISANRQADAEQEADD